MSAAFSPIIMVGAFVFPDVTVGITDVSATLRFCMPFTLKLKAYKFEIFEGKPEIGYFLLPSGDMAERSLKRRKSSKQFCIWYFES